ncbi:hypothetical protein LTR37_000241 [Vermiconidia calcicola]|uniref:Uncharacterized protein n=1 Tax=Vermiconidia calcicola TaxID=1690605 RepID=A0ACC3NZP2_9PEZI|nr:hypothetical protein LTR37_000241 [Vermiconidia calcicola]
MQENSHSAPSLATSKSCADNVSYHGAALGEDSFSIEIEGDKVELKTDPNFDFGKWYAANSPDVRMSGVLECARKVQSQYSWTGAGGQIGFKLASRSNADLFNAVSIGYPGTGKAIEDDIHEIAVPFHIIAPQYDPTFPQEYNDMCNWAIPKLGVDYCYDYYPGVVHGFATKCDAKKELEKKALERAKNAVVH